METPKAARQKHDYTSELELKCLLIRIKNKRTGKELSTKYNSRVNKYVKWYINLNNIKYTTKLMKDRKVRIKDLLKKKAISLAEKTNVDDPDYEQFGKIVLLMIKNILKKPNFSGYTYSDDFHSDAVHKIIKYLHNFDHTLISKSTNLPVNAFAYISQIIHNSIIFIINSKKKELDFIKNHIHDSISDSQLDIKDYDINNGQKEEDSIEVPIKEFIIENVVVSLYKEIELIKDDIIEESKSTDSIINIIYPKTYRISFDEYDQLNDFTKIIPVNLNIVRCKQKEIK